MTVLWSILILFSLIQVGIILYFFVYKNKEADRVYEKRLKEIRERGNR